MQKATSEGVCNLLQNIMTRESLPVFWFIDSSGGQKPTETKLKLPGVEN